MTEHIASADFALPGDDDSRVSRNASRVVSGVLVVLVHLLFLAMLLISVSLPSFRARRPLETILLLPSLNGKNAPEMHMLRPAAPSGVPPEIITSPITLPKPPPLPPEVLPKPPAAGDVLKAVGEALSCGAGSFENLTQAERNRCHHEPWHGGKLPNGSILVLAPAMPKLGEPQPEFRISGADAQRRAIESSPTGCPVLLNVPCLNNIPHDDK
ncbi:MAG TPA: hypothetical protein VHV26_05040 [Rhizomicrobium sp.]|nr:hypothetical protein [Rhizomicrobium sp.]